MDAEQRHPIACLVDLTPAGAVTLHYAACMAARRRTPMVVLYAVPGPPVLVPRPGKPWDLDRTEAEGVIRDLAEFVHAHLARVPEWTAHPMLGAGPAQVAHRARALRARALVVPMVGSLGVGGMGWRESLVERLLPLLPCPLVAVPRSGEGTGRSSADESASSDRQRSRDGRRWSGPGSRGRPEKVRGPVCGMLVDPREAAGSSVYRGRAYVFCAPGCKERFDTRPEGFAILTGAGKRDVWSSTIG